LFENGSVWRRSEEEDRTNISRERDEKKKGQEEGNAGSQVRILYERRSL
jgi:hypothetical protein